MTKSVCMQPTDLVISVFHVQLISFKSLVDNLLIITKFRQFRGAW